MSTDRYLTLFDGRTLHYLEYGDPKGKPIIYMHGGLSCARDIAFADRLSAARGFRIIAPNRPGVAQSSRLPGFAFADTVSDITQLMDALDLSHPALFGWSAGGAHALFAAYSSPGVFSSLVTVGTPSDLNSRGLFSGTVRSLVRRTSTPMILSALLLRSMPSRMQLIQTKLVSRCAADREVLQGMHPSIGELYREAMIQGGEGVTDEFLLLSSVWPQAEEPGPGCPVHLIHGTDDGIVPPENAQQLLSLFPGSELVEIHGQGHFLHHRDLSMILDNFY